jgi:hypothetical protein
MTTCAKILRTSFDWSSQTWCFVQSELLRPAGHADRDGKPAVAGLRRDVSLGAGDLCYNRGVQLIGANRAAPFFFHAIPVFGSVMAIFFLGESLQLFHLFGYGLVLIGVFVAARKPKAA